MKEYLIKNGEVRKPETEEDIQDIQNLVEMFWIFLRNIESKVKEDSVLDKREVEAGYRLWNKLAGTDYKAQWEYIKIVNIQKETPTKEDDNTLLKSKHYLIVTNILKKTLGVSEEEMSLDSDIREDLGADSLDVLEVIMQIEMEYNYNIYIPDNYIAKMRTIRDIIMYLFSVPEKTISKGGLI